MADLERHHEKSVSSSTGDSESYEKLKKSVQLLFTQFLIMIVDNVGVPQNILLVGRPSAGKSSLINLIKSALVGYYDEIAQPGSPREGNINQFTERLQRYPNMGLNDREMTALRDRISSTMDVPEDFRLPTLVDIPGLENNPKLLLELVMDGVVPDRTELSRPMNSGSAPVTDFTDSQRNHIDRIVFVASLTQDAPITLFQTVFNISYRERMIPFTLVLTHSDQTDVPAETMNRRKRQLEGALCISEDSALITHSLVNYCKDDPKDEVERHVYRTNLKKHEDALIAMKMMVYHRPAPLERSAVGQWAPIFLNARRILDGLLARLEFLSPRDALLAVIGVLFVILIFVSILK